jgi:hypothetical protein
MSLNALTSCYVYNTICINKSYHLRDLMILIDNNITHIFTDETMIKRITIIIVKTTILVVIVANDNIIKCDTHNLEF